MGLREYQKGVRRYYNVGLGCRVAQNLKIPQFCELRDFL